MLTSSTKVTVTIPELVGDPSTGGSAITGYFLQWSPVVAGQPLNFVDLAADSLALQHTVSAGIVKGQRYAFRYRASNLYGKSQDWSPIGYAEAIDPPLAPPAPVVTSTTDTTVTLQLFLPLDDGGKPLISLELFRDAGAQDGSEATTAVTSYTSTSFALTHTLSTTGDGLTTGKIYNFRTRAVNAKGVSQYSDLAVAPLASVPPQPASPQIDQSRSSGTALHITWTPIPDDPAKSPAADIIGYTLFMASPATGASYTAVLDTKYIATDVTSFLVSAPAHPVSPGSTYHFFVVAHNRAGKSPASAISSFLACSKPSGLSAPFKVSTSITGTVSITVGWHEPSNTGGCPIVGYAVYYSLGLAGTFSEAATALRAQPTARQHQILQATTVGAVYRIKVHAITSTHEVASPEVGIVLADLPLKPPAMTLLSTSSSLTVVDVSGFPTASNGGCTVLSFDI